MIDADQNPHLCAFDRLTHFGRAGRRQLSRETMTNCRALAYRLAGGMPIEDFDRDVRERRPARFESAFDAISLKELFTLRRLEKLFTRNVVSARYVDVITDGFPRKLTDIQRNVGRAELGTIAAHLQSGSTIRLIDAHLFDDGLSDLVANVQHVFAAETQINVYLAPPEKAGFAAHFDITDVFVVQCTGQKEWQVFDEYVDRTELPLLDTPWEPERYRPLSRPRDMTLHQGDVLYMPRGTMHRAFCTRHASMHLTISIIPLTFADLLRQEIRRIAASDADLRRRVPWSVGDGDDRLEEFAEYVTGCLVDLAQRLDVRAALRSERQRLQAEPLKAGSGALSSVIAKLANDAHVR
jgi:ribosomal protein L16 Arg81 hydroxylase